MNENRTSLSKYEQLQTYYIILFQFVNGRSLKKDVKCEQKKTKRLKMFKAYGIGINREEKDDDKTRKRFRSTCGKKDRIHTNLL